VTTPPVAPGAGEARQPPPGRDARGWLDVGFGLRPFPSGESARAEFGDALQQALEQAVLSVRLKRGNTPAPAVIARTPSVAGAYQDAVDDAAAPRGSHWLLRALRERPYLVDALVHLYARVWGTMLEQSLAAACARIASGQTMLGLLSAVRSMNRWLLADFLQFTVRTVIAGDWNLLAVSRLPALPAGEVPALVVRGGRAVDANALRMHLAIAAVRATVPPNRDDVLALPTLVSSAPVASAQRFAARTPMFPALRARVADLLLLAWQRPPEVRDGPIVGDLPQQEGHDALVTRVRAVASLLARPDHSDVQSAIAMVQSHPETWADWASDIASLCGVVDGVAGVTDGVLAAMGRVVSAIIAIAADAPAIVDVGGGEGLPDTDAAAVGVAPGADPAPAPAPAPRYGVVLSCLLVPQLRPAVAGIMRIVTPFLDRARIPAPELIRAIDAGVEEGREGGAAGGPIVAVSQAVQEAVLRTGLVQMWESLRAACELAAAADTPAARITERLAAWMPTMRHLRVNVMGSRAMLRQIGAEEDSVWRCRVLMTMYLVLGQTPFAGDVTPATILRTMHPLDERATDVAGGFNPSEHGLMCMLVLARTLLSGRAAPGVAYDVMLWNLVTVARWDELDATVVIHGLLGLHGDVALGPEQAAAAALVGSMTVPQRTTLLRRFVHYDLLQLRHVVGVLSAAIERQRIDTAPPFLPRAVLAAATNQSRHVYATAAQGRLAVDAQVPAAWAFPDTPEGSAVQDACEQVIGLLVATQRSVMEEAAAPIAVAAQQFTLAQAAAAAGEGRVHQAMTTAAAGLTLCAAIGTHLSGLDATLDALSTPDVTASVSTLVAQAPGAWSPFLLSRVVGLDQTRRLLSASALLRAWGMDAWVCDGAAEAESGEGIPALLPCQYDRGHAWYAAYRQIANIVARMATGDDAVAADNRPILAWAAAAQAAGPVVMARARGLLVLALYHCAWLNRVGPRRSAPGVAAWAAAVPAGAAAVPADARLGLTADTAAMLQRLAQGPQPYPAAFVGAGRGVRGSGYGLQWLFSSDAMAGQQLPLVAVERSALVACLAIALGAPPDRLYYTTALVTPGLMDPYTPRTPHGQPLGLGTGHSNLTKDCGLQIMTDTANPANPVWRFADSGPAVPPFPHPDGRVTTLSRLLNNALITAGWAWHLFFFPDRHELFVSHHLFSFVAARDEYDGRLDPAAHPAVATATYAEQRARQFMRCFFQTEQAAGDGREAALSWGAGVQAAWDLCSAAAPPAYLRAFYFATEADALGKLRDTMAALSASWAAAFTDEVRLREAHRQAMGTSLVRCINAIDRARRAVAILGPGTGLPARADVCTAVDLATREGVAAAQRMPAAFLLSTVLGPHAGEFGVSRHVPLLARTYDWFTGAFEHLLTPEEARGWSVLDALALLPPAAQVEGRALVDAFLAAWAELRDVFVTYQQCGQEIAAAAPIEPLSLHAAADTVQLTVAHLVTLGDDGQVGEVQEERDTCAPIRMLHHRLLLHQRARGLTNASVQLVKSDGADKLNRWGWLVERPPPELDVSDLLLGEGGAATALLSMTWPPEGVNAEVAAVVGEELLDDALAAHTAWVVDTPFVDEPPAPEGPTADQLAALQREEQEREGRANQQEAHANQRIMCPRCRIVIEHIWGCDAMVCGRNYHNPEMPVRGCGAALSAAGNRVPPPPADGPPDPAFMPVARAVDAPPPPARPADAPPPPRGHWQADAASLARQTLPRMFAARALLSMDRLRRPFLCRMVAPPAAAAAAADMPAATAVPRAGGTAPFAGDAQAAGEFAVLDPSWRMLAAGDILLRALDAAGVRPEARALSQELEVQVAQWLRSCSQVAHAAAVDDLTALATSIPALPTVARRPAALAAMAGQEALRSCAPPRGKWASLTTQIVSRLTVPQLPTAMRAVQRVMSRSAYSDIAALDKPLVQAQVDRLNGLLSGTWLQLDVESMRAVGRQIAALATKLQEGQPALVDAEDLQPIAEVEPEGLARNLREEDCADAAAAVLARDITVPHYGPIMRFLRKAAGTLLLEAGRRDREEEAAARAAGGPVIAAARREVEDPFHEWVPPLAAWRDAAPELARPAAAAVPPPAAQPPPGAPAPPAPPQRVVRATLRRPGRPDAARNCAVVMQAIGVPVPSAPAPTPPLAARAEPARAPPAVPPAADVGPESAHARMHNRRRVMARLKTMPKSALGPAPAPTPALAPAAGGTGTLGGRGARGHAPATVATQPSTSARPVASAPLPALLPAGQLPASHSTSVPTLPPVTAPAAPPAVPVVLTSGGVANGSPASTGVAHSAAAGGGGGGGGSPSTASAAPAPPPAPVPVPPVAIGVPPGVAALLAPDQEPIRSSQLTAEDLAYLVARGALQEKRVGLRVRYTSASWHTLHTALKPLSAFAMRIMRQAAMRIGRYPAVDAGAGGAAAMPGPHSLDFVDEFDYSTLSDIAPADIAQALEEELLAPCAVADPTPWARVMTRNGQRHVLVAEYDAWAATTGGLDFQLEDVPTDPSAAVGVVAAGAGVSFPGVDLAPADAAALVQAGVLTAGQDATTVMARLRDALLPAEDAMAMLALTSQAELTEAGITVVGWNGRQWVLGAQMDAFLG